MTDSSPAPTPTGPRDSNALTIGALLVIGGIVLFAAQLVDFDLAALGWPAIVIGIGLVLLILGLTVSAEEGMVVGGTVVTTVGLVLFYQDQTGNWATWAYAWALVGPAASGLGMLLWGVRAGSASDVRNGMWALLGGLGIFAIGFLFFEGIIGISGERFPIADWVLPVVVIGIGVVVLGRGLMSRGGDEPGDVASD